MATFKSPRRGGNVVHRLQIEATSGRRARRRRLIGSQDPLGHAARPPAPAPAPAPAPVEAREEAPARDDAQSLAQIDLLERRLQKLSRLLDERDREILSMAARRSDADTGVASIYREVQGVQGRGKEAKQRREFMSRIFEANLKLRERVRPASS